MKGFWKGPYLLHRGGRHRHQAPAPFCFFSGGFILDFCFRGSLCFVFLPLLPVAFATGKFSGLMGEAHPIKPAPVFSGDFILFFCEIRAARIELLSTFAC